MHIKDHNDAMKFFRTYDNVASKGKWKEFVDEMEFESMLQEPRTMAQEPRNMYAGGQLVQNTADGSRPGFAGIKEVKNVKKFKKLPGVELGDYYFEVRNTEYAGPGKGGSPRITVGPFKNKKVAQKAFDERSKKVSKIKQANLDLVTDVSNQQTKQINDFVTDFYDKNITKYDIKDFQSFEKKLIEEFKTLGIKDSTRRRAIDTFGFPNIGKFSVKGKRGSSLPLSLYGMGARIPSGNVMQSDAQAFFKKTFYSAQLEKNPQLVKNLKRYLDYYNTDKKFYKGTYIDREALRKQYADVLDPKVQSDLLYLLESDEIGTGKLRGGFLKQYLPEEYKTYIEKKNRFNLRYKQLMNTVENSLTKEQLNLALNGETSIKRFMTKQTDLLNKIFDTSELKKAGYSELIFNADHLEGMSEIAQMDNAEDKIRALRNLVGTTSKRNYELGIEGFSSKRKSLMGKIKNGTNVKDNMDELNKITKEVYPQFKGDLYKYHPATKTATPTKNFIVKYDPETAFRQYFNELVKDPIGSKILKKQYLDKPELQKVIEKDPELKNILEKDFMKNRKLLIEKAKANAALKTAKKGGFGEQVKKICGLAKGGRVGFALGPDSCALIETDPKRFLNEIVQVDKGVVGKFFKTPQAVKIAKGVARSANILANPFSWIGGEAWYVGLEGMNSHSKGVPWIEALDDAFIFHDFKQVDENIMDTASKMNLDENSMALLKNTMNINRIDSELGKAESFLKMEQIGLPEGNLIGRDPSDLTDQQNTVASYKRYISDKQEQLNDEIGVYKSNVGKLFNKDPNTLDDYELYKGFGVLSNVFRKKVLTERQEAYKDIATRADPLAGNLGNWLNTNLFNLDVWKPKHLLTTKLTPQQEKQKYLDEIGSEFIPGTKIPNPKYNPRELYLYNRDARNLTPDSPLAEEALALRSESQPVLGTGTFNRAIGGRVGYTDGGLTRTVAPDSEGIMSLKKK